MMISNLVRTTRFWNNLHQVTLKIYTTRFWNNLHQVTLKIENLESQIIKIVYVIARE